MHKPCRYRKAEEDGRITCSKITQGDTQVSPNICRSCPAAAINCSHLRFTLLKFTPTTILVRYGNGRTEIWNDEPPRLEFLHAACALKVMPLESPRQCAGCTLRCPTVAEEEEGERPRVLQPVQAIPFPAQNMTSNEVPGTFGGQYDQASAPKGTL